MSSPEEWERISDELSQLIGDVTLNLTSIEESLDSLIVDLLVLPPLYRFVQEFVLGRMGLNDKIQLLKNYSKEFPDLIADADLARSHLEAIERANRERNRLVHDLHEVDFEDGKVSRRRLWQEDAQNVDLEDYRELAGMISILAGPTIDALYEALLQ